MTIAAFADIPVIDVDTHLTEHPDLWTSRAPEGWKEHVPRVVNADGKPSWVIEDVVIGPAHAFSVVAPDGTKLRGTEFYDWGIDDTHRAAWDTSARLEYMDQQGIHAQILYPNAGGLGSQKFAMVADPELRVMCATLYNDAMASIQADSGGRLFPMAMIPWWDPVASVQEVRRAHAMGLKGINTCAEPHNRGTPDLGDRVWDPFWEVCSELAMPVNFHIGAGDSAMSWFGSTPWPSHGPNQKLVIGGAMIFMSNAAVLANLIVAGVLERFPDLEVVSVESGIGWIPWVLEALDYQILESSPETAESLSMKPSEYFRRQVYGCFWFERSGLTEVIESLGADRILFETDFPHPTCLYPESLRYAETSLAEVSDDVRRKILHDNAASLYRIP